MKKRSCLLFGAAFFCLALLFVGQLGPGYPRSYYYLWDLGHLICFALWAYFYINWRTTPHYWQLCLQVLVLTVLIGGLTELIQSGLGRTASWPDLGKDLLGSLLALAFFAPARKRVSRWQLQLLQLSVFALLLWSLLPLVRVLSDELIARQQFPLLSGFEISSEAARWGGGSSQQRDQQIAYSGASSLRVQLNTQRYSGVGLQHFPADWSGFRLLRFHLYNPEPEPLQLHFRIHDHLHRVNGSVHSDRFNTSLTLASGWNKIEIPLDKVIAAPKKRSMEIERIAGVIFFVGKLERPRSFNIDEVLLVR